MATTSSGGTRPGRGVHGLHWALTGLFIGLGILVLGTQIQGYPDPSALFSDASLLYWAATQAWVDGGNPWAVASANGTTFAGWPPTLLNVPLLPFGPDAARAFWAIADVVGWVVVIWRLGSARGGSCFRRSSRGCSRRARIRRWPARCWLAGRGWPR